MGEYPNVSSRVTCVVDLFGPTDLLTMGGGHNSIESFLGGQIQENEDAARNASPITFVSMDDPPFMLIHGMKDQADSERMHAALQRVQVQSVLIPIVGSEGRLGTPNTKDETRQVAERMRQFFDKHLLGKDVVVSAEPINPKKGQ